MVIEKTPFRTTRLDEERSKDKGLTFTVRLNDEEKAWLEKSQKTLEQPKDSTAFKTLAKIGEIVLHDEKTLLIISSIFKNRANNARTGNEFLE